MKKIISFALWGNVPKYTIGAIRNAQLAKEIYPGWIPRFYVGSSTADEIRNELKVLSAEVVEMEAPGDWTGMFWRFLPAGEADVEVMISRDADSRLAQREKAAVDQWLASDKGFHIMRDHPQHDAPILGGMWGVRGDALRGMPALIDSFPKGDYWQIDQEFLRRTIYPIVGDNAVVHDEFFGGDPFPTRRVAWEFVGEVFDENGIGSADHSFQLRESLRPINRLKRRVKQWRKQLRRYF